MIFIRVDVVTYVVRSWIAVEIGIDTGIDAVIDGGGAELQVAIGVERIDELRIAAESVDRDNPYLVGDVVEERVVILVGCTSGVANGIGVTGMMVSTRETLESLVLSILIAGTAISVELGIVVCRIRAG